MYHQNPRVRDAQNPYRTGVLIGNCWEDKFGRELATQPVSALKTINVLDLRQKAHRLLNFCRNKEKLEWVKPLRNSLSEHQLLPTRMLQRPKKWFNLKLNMLTMLLPTHTHREESRATLCLDTVRLRTSLRRETLSQQMTLSMTRDRRSRRSSTHTHSKVTSENLAVRCKSMDNKMICQRCLERAALLLERPCQSTTINSLANTIITVLKWTLEMSLTSRCEQAITTHVYLWTCT